MLKRAGAIRASGVNFITLLALSDDGAPGYGRNTAEAFATMGIPSFACTPDKFPELIAAAIQQKDLSNWGK
jgi:hypothetical protein